MPPESDIPVLKPGMDMKNPGEKQPEADDTARRLYSELLPSVVQITTDKGKGSGFFVDKEGRVVTDAHVVLGSNEQFVVTSDGRKFKAQVEKLDDVHDLATLTVKGLKDTKPLSLGTSDGLAQDQPLWALGHPLGKRPAYISPGYFRFMSDQMNMLANADQKSLMAIVQSVGNLTPKEQEDAKQGLGRSLVHGLVRVDHGSSGGPLVDASGKVVGVADMIDPKDTAQSYHTPVENVKDMLSSPSKFATTYSWAAESWAQTYKNQWLHSPATAIGETGLAGVAGLGAYRLLTRFPKAMGLGLGAYGASGLAEDLMEYSQATDSRDSWKFGLSSLADATTAAGAVMTFIRPARTIGMVALGVGVAGRLATDFIPNRWTMTDLRRVDGDPRPPYELERVLHSKPLEKH